MTQLSESSHVLVRCSPAPWSYDYSPYRLQDGRELPAFEVFDAEGNKLFDTNEDSPAELQEANAQLAAVALELLALVIECLRLLADHDENDGEEGEIYRQGMELLSRCPQPVFGPGESG